MWPARTFCAARDAFGNFQIIINYVIHFSAVPTGVSGEPLGCTKICVECTTNSIKHIHPLMRGAIEREIIPRFELLVNNMQQQKSH